ncbi:MAG TPA: protocatechuate 3,4-dioxygenase subunit alpha [Acetobacteraceae bacterium]|nr:protocatechuate 3,4-dioxygenase subunit alpha [Acetobacteraceae bacterium]
MTPATASQTIGPYWALIEHKEMADLTRFGAAGERVVLTGRVTDGDGAPVTDAAIELWQSDPPASEHFPGWGRCGTNAQGRYSFTTLRPGPVPGPGNRLQAPHFAISILARGILATLCTRAYLAGERLNEDDPVLALVEDPARRATLIAHESGAGTWELDIRLQGADETVFFAI